MNIKRILEFNLDLSNPLKRILRRALIVGLLTAVSIGLTGYMELAPEYIAPIIVAILAAIDKGIREHKN